MKKLLPLIALLLPLAAFSQATNAAPEASPNWLSQLWSFAQKTFTDASPYYTNGVITEAGALITQHDVGAFFDLQVPLENQMSVGGGFAYLGGNLYDASITARLGTTWNVPVIGLVYSFAEDGPGYNFTKEQVVNHGFGGLEWKKQVLPWLGVSVGGAVGNISDIPGVVYGAGGSLNFKIWKQ